MMVLSALYTVYTVLMRSELCCTVQYAILLLMPKWVLQGKKIAAQKIVVKYL
jgi:hypothetical protein